MTGVAVQVVDETDRSERVEAPTDCERSHTALAVGYAVLYVSVMLVSNWSTFTTALTEDGDIGADAIRAEHWWRQTTGIYSRWDFHHPGPAPFWVKGIGLTAADLLPWIGPLGGQQFAQLALATAGIGVCGWVVARASGRRSAIPLAYVVGAISGQGSQLTPWAPNMAHWFVLLGIGGLAALTLGRRWALPVAVAGGLAALHAHVVFAPAGLVLLVLAGVLRWRLRDRFGSRTDVGAAVAVATLMVVPLVVAVVSGDSSWSKYAHQSGQQGSGLRSWDLALRITADTISPTGTSSDVAPFLIVLAVGVMALAAIAVLQRRQFDAPSVVAAAGLAWLGYMVAISRLSFIVDNVAGAILPILLITPVAVVLPTERSSMLLCTGVAVLVAFFGVGSARLPDGIAEQVLATHTTGETLIVDHQQSSYRPAIATVLLAQRSGIPVCVLERRWPYWADESLICPVGAQGEIVTFTSNSAWTPSRG